MSTAAGAPSSRLHALSVERAWDETSVLRGLRLDAPVELRATHRRPGQYLKVRSDGREGHFALASPPGAPLELLVKRGGAVGDAVATLAAGAAIEASDALGSGFPVEESAGRDLLLFAAGSGITPIRAVVRHVLDARDRFGRVLVFYGQRRADEFAYRGEQAAWAAGSVELVPVLSGDDPAWRGARGHVQEALLDARPSVANAAAFVSGMKGMIAGVRDALGALGLAAERIHLNY
jgi:sulfhydrogenase subunit gamma (sulfur reductase)